MRVLGLVAVLLSGSALAAETDVVTLSKAACGKLVGHIPADDVTYKGGVDVRGRPVVPADVGPAIELPEDIRIQIGIDLADRLAIREARRPTPGLPGPASPVRPVLPYEGKAALGELTIKGNDAYWNGKLIAPQDEAELAQACREGLIKAGVILPERKPAPP